MQAVAGLSRRQFLALTGALGASAGLNLANTGGALAAPVVPAGDAPSTLLQTVTQRAKGYRGYRTLTSAPGEPYLARTDLLGRSATNGRARVRRSLFYLGHLSDVHIIDAQSPARVEPLLAQSVATWSGSARPQDTLTTHVLAQMVSGLNLLRNSPLTGAPVAAYFNTGDNADMLADLELEWYIKILDGATIIPNSGAPNIYEGVQAWEETQMIYHPEAPGNDAFGSYGYPRISGLLDAAVSHPVTSEGLQAPWYTVFGNHDALYFGFFPVDSALHSLALGQAKPYEWQALGLNYAQGWAQQLNPLSRAVHNLTTQVGLRSGFNDVTPDDRRALFDQRRFIQAHLDSPASPGPVGHGFTQENIENDTTYWSTTIGSRLRVFGLDTCNSVLGADGAVPQDQFDWLEAGLADARRNNQFVVIMSHHNSLTLENGAQPTIGPSQPLIHADQFIAMLVKYPNMIAWINGHTHVNTIQAHASPDGPGGFWEITTASCIDFPQQQQMIEIVDNRDGTISLFTTVVDHDSHPEWQPGDFSQAGLASLSRELASNDFTADPLMRRGSAASRNTELLLPAPFDVAAIKDAEIEAMHIVARARQEANKTGAQS